MVSEYKKRQCWRALPFLFAHAITGAVEVVCG